MLKTIALRKVDAVQAEPRRLPAGGGVFMHGREGVGLTYSPMSSPLTSWREAYIFFMSFMSFRILASDPPGPGWQGGRPRPKALVPVEVSGGRAGMPCRM